MLFRSLAKVLGCPRPLVRYDALLGAYTARFDVRGQALTLAEPAGEGMAQRALGMLGAGVAVLSIATRSIEACETALRDGGIAAQPVGNREGLLVAPDAADGVWVHFTAQN